MPGWQSNMNQTYGTGGAWRGTPGTLGQSFGQSGGGALWQSLTGGQQSQGIQPQPQGFGGTPAGGAGGGFGAGFGPAGASGTGFGLGPAGDVSPASRSPFGMSFTPQMQAAAAAGQFGAMFGGMPTSRAREIRDAEQAQGKRSQGGLIAPLQSGSAAPAQAGAMNSAAPGFFNGNETQGVPSAEGGFAAQSQSAQRTGEAREPIDPAPMSAQSTQAQATTTGTAPVYNPADQATWFTPDGMSTWTNEQIAADQRGPERWLLDPTTVPGWATMSPEAKAAVRRDLYNPYPTTLDYWKSAPDASVLDDWKRVYGSDPTFRNLGNLPTVSASGIAGRNMDFGSQQLTQEQIASLGLNSTLTGYIQQLRNIGQQLAADPNLTGTNAARQSRIYNELGAMLENVYGIKWNPIAAYTTPGPNPDDAGGSLPDNTTIDTRLPNLSTKIGDLTSAIGGNMNNAPLIEFAMQQWLLENAMENQQKGIYLLDDTVKQSLAANNPLRQQSETLALQALQNPDPVDWSGIRNRLGTDYARNREVGSGQLADSLAMRGLSPAMGAGMQAQMNSANRGELARALGELTTQEQQGRRAAIYDAITNASNVDRNYRGAESQLRQMLANAVMGTPDAAANPYAGITDYRLGREAMRIQEEAADGGGSSGLLAALGPAAGSLSPGLLGGAGSLFGAIFGGSGGSNSSGGGR